MDWEEEDITQRFASNLVPRQSPTKQEEELLKSKVEARRLLMKLNRALGDLRAHMLPEIEEEDGEDTSGAEAVIHRRTKSARGGHRRRGAESETDARRQNHADVEDDDNKPSFKRPEWNTRFQPTDSPLDYEAPRHKRGFLPASPARTLRKGSAKNKKGSRTPTRMKKQWDSRIIATRSALDDIPKQPNKQFYKKRVVSMKDLEHLASLAPTASLKELLDIGKHAVRTQAIRKSRKTNTFDAEGYVSSSTNDSEDEADDNIELNHGTTIHGDDSDATESFEEENLDEYDEDEMTFDNEQIMLPETGKSLASVGGGSVSTLLKKYESVKRERSRQIRYTKKSVIKSSGDKKSKKNRKASTIKKLSRKNRAASTKRKKIAKIRANNKQRLKRMSKTKKNAGLKKFSGPTSHIRWHRGDVLQNPNLSRSPGGILKHRIKSSSSAPVLGEIRGKRQRPQSAPGMRRNNQKGTMNSSLGMDSNGLLQWNWNGPSNNKQMKPKIDPTSPSSLSHWSNKINISKHSRPLHLPKRRKHTPEKIPVTKFRPRPITSGGKTLAERIQNYRLEHFPEYARLGEGQMCVTIAHCSNCRTHQLTTRHDEAKFSSYAHQLASGIKLAMPLVKVVVKPVGRRLIGAFEVQMCRQEAQKLTKTLLHSKLLTNAWPNISLLIDRIKKFTPKHELVVNVSAHVNDHNIFSNVGAKVVDAKGEVVCGPKPIISLRSLERNLERGTVSLLVPSGSYTLVVEGLCDDEGTGVANSNKFLPMKEHIDTSEEVRTIIDRVLSLKRHLVVNVTRAQRSQACSGAQVLVADKYTKDTVSGLCDNEGLITFMLGPVPQKEADGTWPPKGFTNNLIITAQEIGGNSNSKSVACGYPDIKPIEGSIIEIDVGGIPIYDDDFQ